MNQEVHVATGATNNTKVLRGYRVTSVRRMIVHSGRIFVDLVTCFGNSYVLSAAHGKVTGSFNVSRALQLGNL